MTEIIIFIGVIIGLNCIPFLIKSDIPKTSRLIVKLLIVAAILFLVFSTLGYNGYKLKGKYTFTAIGLIFIGLSAVYFAIYKTTKIKILTVALLIPFLAASIFALVFNRTLKEFRINEDSKIVVVSGGLLSCGEVIFITQTKLGFFDKEVHYENSLCLRGIEKIETLKYDENYAEFLIYHNMELDSENPYKYIIERKVSNN